MEVFGMMVFVSTKTPKKGRVYHKDGCIYAKRINPNNVQRLPKTKAESKKYCECTYCGGLKGYFRVMEKTIGHWEIDNNIKCTYDKKTNTAYIQTDIGFWKFFVNEDLGGYLLYHRNVYQKGMDLSEAIKGDFHRQRDFKVTESITAIVNYVISHDKAMGVIKDDYRRLPKHSKKQKKYYRQAKNRVKRKAIRNVYSIFDMLESKDPELKYAYKEAAFC